MKPFHMMALLLLGIACHSTAQTQQKPMATGQAHWEISELTLPSFSKEKKGMRPGHQGRLAMHNGGAWFPKKNTPRTSLGEATFPMIVLHQDRFRVEILPGNASSIHRVIEPDGTDWFYKEERIKDWIPWWESGIKANFPFMEHGIREIQPSAWQVIQDGENRVRYSSWMEFSRHHSIQESVQFGRHSNILLEQEIEVVQGDPRLRLTYRVTNPSYYKQGLQVWNDAFWPRFHHADGIAHGGTPLQFPDDAEIIGAMDWASDHMGHELGPFDPEVHNPRNTSKKNFSYFVWDVQDGWTGLYYPAVDVARIRLVDPEKAPGTKWWWHQTGNQTEVNHNFIEMWGGSDHVFEGVERWLGPGQQWEATWTYLYVKGIGKPLVANTEGILAMKENMVHAITYRPLKEVSLWVNGQKSRTGPISYDTPLTVEVTEPTLIELRSGDQILLRADLPRKPLPMREEMRKQISTSLDYDNPVGSEMQGNQHTRGRYYRNAKYKPNTLGSVRVLIRDGRLDSAIKQLKVIVDESDAPGEAWCLLGACYMEKEKHEEATVALKQALRVQDSDPHALFLLAVNSLSKQDTDQAQEYLDDLIRQIPTHQEGRLLRAFLSNTTNDAAALTMKHPADPRVRWVATEVFSRIQGKAGSHDEILATLLQQEPGATARVEEFKALTKGTLVHPQRLETP